MQLKIQYLGFLPAIIVVLIAHWKVISFYNKYKTFDYFSPNVPEFGVYPFGWIIIFIAFWFGITTVGIMWAIR